MVARSVHLTLAFCLFLTSCLMIPIGGGKTNLISALDFRFDTPPIWDFRTNKNKPKKPPGYRSYKTRQFIPPPLDEQNIDMTISEAEAKTRKGMEKEDVTALFGEKRLVSEDGETWEYYIFPKTWDGDVWILTIYFEKGRVAATKRSVAGSIPSEFRNE